jgi:hypothetical protein
VLIFDFFSGTGSSTQAFVDGNHTVISFELNPEFESTHTIDMFDVDSEWLYKEYGRPDFIWASPPCTSFSVASIGHHWSLNNGVYTPKTQAAVMGEALVFHTRELIEDLKPVYGFLIENPRGMLRKLNAVAGLPRTTITYCQYGDDRMKPTDLWGHVANWIPRNACKNGDKCHVSAPRGSLTGTQGIKGARDRSRVPYQLGLEIMYAIERNGKD